MTRFQSFADLFKTIGDYKPKNVTNVLLAIALLISSFSQTSTSYAAPGNMVPPFDIGQTWYICQGYNNPSVTHTGTSAYGLDLVGGPSCSNSAAGRNVRAPLNGTVAYYQSTYGNLCINVAGNRSISLTHINPTVTSGSVTAGQKVGTVAAAVGANTPPNNGGVAHLHFQIWSSPGCYNSSVLPFDSAHGARICGAPDLTSSGPSGTGNGTWSGTSFTGDVCGVPATPTPPPLPLVVARNGSDLWANDAATNSWQMVSNTASQGQWAVTSNRIALKDANGLWVKDGSGGWVRWGDPNFDEMQISSSLIAVRSGSDLWVNDASDHSWFLLSNTASAGNWLLAGNRIALKDANGLWVREGFATNWVRWGDPNFDEMQISSSLIAVRSGSDLWVNDDATHTWYKLSDTVSAGQWLLSGSRLVVKDANGLWVREGFATNWVRWGDPNFDEMQISPNWVVVRTGSDLYMKDSVGGPWYLISNSASAGQWQVSGGRIILRDANGLWVKDGGANWVRWGDPNLDEMKAG